MRIRSRVYFLYALTYNNNDMYKIVGKTNPWIAQRDIHFNGRTTITIGEGLTLKEANAKLLRMFQKDYDDLPTSYPNIGIALMNSNEFHRLSDGCCSYHYDSRHYAVVNEEEED